ncbi:transposase [Streptomyces sp. NPDC001732]
MGGADGLEAVGTLPLCTKNAVVLVRRAEADGQIDHLRDDPGEDGEEGHHGDDGEEGAAGPGDAQTGGEDPAFVALPAGEPPLRQGVADDYGRAELVVDALDMAHGRGGLESGCVIHSDRGSEYTSTQFRERIEKLGLRQSCGRTGSCFDNAAAESFWALLKEEIGTRTWPDRATARAEVFNFIEAFYNRRLRKHKTFGYLTPAETRQRHQHALAA